MVYFNTFLERSDQMAGLYQRDRLSKVVAQNLRKVRTEHHFSKRQLAEYLHISPGTLTIWMNADSIPKKNRLQEALAETEYSLRDIIVAKGDMMSPNQWLRFNCQVLLKTKYFNQTALIKQTRVSEQKLAEILAGIRFPAYRTVEALAKYFRITPNQLESHLPDHLILQYHLEKYLSSAREFVRIEDL